MAGTQNKITHQNLSMFENISIGMIPNTAATAKPKNPEIHLNLVDQNLNKASEIIHNPIESPNKSRFIPNF